MNLRLLSANFVLTTLNSRVSKPSCFSTRTFAVSQTPHACAGCANNHKQRSKNTAPTTPPIVICTTLEDSARFC